MVPTLKRLPYLSAVIVAAIGACHQADFRLTSVINEKPVYYRQRDNQSDVA